MCQNRRRPAPNNDLEPGQAVQLNSFAEFKSSSGGLDPRSESSYQVLQFFLNGGGTSFAVRVVPADSTTAVVNAAPANDLLPRQTSRLTIQAANEGAWGNYLQAIAYQTPTQANQSSVAFNLEARLLDQSGNVVSSESYENLTWGPNDPRYCVSSVNPVSELIRLVDNGDGPGVATPEYYIQHSILPGAPWLSLRGGSDGTWQPGEFPKAIIEMLDPGGSPLTRLSPELFNLLCLPAVANFDSGATQSVMLSAAALCVSQRAFLIADIPPSQVVTGPKKMIDWFNGLTLTQTQKECAAVYYPRIQIPDPLENYRLKEIGTSGTMAGIYAGTDTNRGVWKAPAGITAGLAGAKPVYALSDGENRDLNQWESTQSETFRCMALSVGVPEPWQELTNLPTSGNPFRCGVSLSTSRIASPAV